LRKHGRKHLSAAGKIGIRVMRARHPGMAAEWGRRARRTRSPGRKRAVADPKEE